jgi:hypothetical protein
MAQHSHFPTLEIKAKPPFMFTNGGVQIFRKWRGKRRLEPTSNLGAFKLLSSCNGSAVAIRIPRATHVPPLLFRQDMRKKYGHELELVPPAYSLKRGFTSIFL